MLLIGASVLKLQVDEKDGGIPLILEMGEFRNLLIYKLAGLDFTSC